MRLIGSDREPDMTRCATALDMKLDVNFSSLLAYLGSWLEEALLDFSLPSVLAS